MSIQSSTAEGWGDQEPTLAISYRDDSFGAVEDQAVDIFSSSSPTNMGLRKDGTCNFGTSADDVFSGDLISGNCVWNDNDEATDVNGNILAEGEVLAGNTRVFYAWIGSKDGEDFDADDADEQTVSVTAKNEQASLDGDSDINMHAYDEGSGQQVDLRNGRDVTATAQLLDDDDKNVERAGVSIRVEYRQGEITAGARDSRSYVNTHEATLVTDDDGSVSFSVSPPANSTRVDDQERKDSVWFIELDSNGNDTSRDAEVLIHWIEETPVLTSDSLDMPVYVLADNPSVGTTVRLWDQYGNSHRSNSNQKVEITYTDSETGDDDDSDSAVRQVISRGYARWATKIEVDSGETVAVTYDVRQLARNSDGSAVRAGTDPEQVDDFAEWMGFGSGQSSATRQALIDDLDVTYNDGRVITSDDKNAEGDYTSDIALYQAPADDDNDANTGPENDDDDPDDPDPILVFARPGEDQDLRNILNSHALDTYVDRGDGLMVPNADDANDGSGTVQVVEKADSTDVGDDVLYVTHVLQSEGRFLTSADDTVEADLVYSYDDDDIFINSTGAEGVEITMAKFEGLIDDNSPKAALNDARTHVQVIAYDVDGTSIFRVVNEPTGN